jgi:CDP-L-myo-inositol myo-inositolphosphotransferase
LTTFACLLLGTASGLIAGCVFYHVTSVVDGLDGEIARAKYMATRAGAALDTGVDMASNLLFMIGISIGDAQVFGDTYLWMGAFIAATAVAAIIIMTLVLRLGPGGGSFDVLQLTIEQRLAPWPRLARAFLLANAGFKRDLFAFVFAILGLAHAAQAIPWCLAFGTSTWLVTIVVNVPAMLRANRDAVLPAHLRPARATITATLPARIR